MGRPPEEAEVRQMRDWAVHSSAVHSPVSMDAVRALCDSWLAQARVIDTLRRWCEDDAGSRKGFIAIADIRHALAAGGETETPPEGTTP